MKIKYKLLAVVFFLALFSSNNIYSQENAFFINLGSSSLQVLLLPKLGIGYEKKINDFSSYLFTGDLAGYIGTIMDASYGWESTFQIDFLAHFRWYPFNTSLKRLFLDLGTGFSLYLVRMENTAASVQFPLQAMVGWRFSGKKYFIQPWIGYRISFGKINNPQYLSNEFEELVKYGFPCIGLAAGFLF
jgi:hypothetical protein